MINALLYIKYIIKAHNAAGKKFKIIIRGEYEKPEKVAKYKNRVSESKNPVKFNTLKTYPWVYK